MEIPEALKAQANGVLEPLAAKKAEWAAMSREAKRAILREIGDRVADWGFCYEWAKCEMTIKKMQAVDDGATAAAVYGLGNAVMVHRTIQALDRGLEEGLQVPKADLKRDFQVDTSANVYLTDINPIAQVKTYLFVEGDTRCHAYREGAKSELCVVLGAGNVSAVTMMDTLYHTFVEGRVCVLKHHPLQSVTKPFFDHALHPLIRAGFLISIDAGTELTQALIYSDLVDCVHLTGGIHTHDAIVFGTKDQAANKAAGTPILRAKMCSELGCITPYIVLPSSDGRSDEWDDSAIAKYAMYCKEGLYFNCSCACLSAKVIILPADFPDLTDRFVTAFKKLVRESKLEPAWYPGIKQRYHAWLEAHQANGVQVDVYSEAAQKRVGDVPEREYLPFAVADVGTLSRADLDRLDSVYKNHSWMKVEPFAPVVTVVRVSGATAAEYTANAFHLADTHLWGNLSCAVFTPPSTQPAAVALIAAGALRYGTVILNKSTIHALQPAGYWGGPAGRNTPADAQSGVGNVGNALMFDAPQRALVASDFAAAPLAGDLALPRWVALVACRLITLGVAGLWPFSKYPMAT